MKAGGSRPRYATQITMASTEALSFNGDRPSLSPSAPFWRVCLGDSNPEQTHETSVDDAIQGFKKLAFLCVISYTSQQ